MAPTRAIGIVGHSPAARAYVAGAQALGWSCHVIDLGGGRVPTGEVIVPAPLPDDIDDVAGRYAFGWPLVSTASIQELLRRLPAVGTITTISSRSTRPAPAEADSIPGGVLFQSAHDQVALTLLVARLGGLGRPVSVAASGTVGANGRHDSVDVEIGFETGLVASVHADWHSNTFVSREFQVAGKLGVLRSETDPRLALEHNGDPVPLAPAHVTDDSHRPLQESGVIDMLKTIGAGFDSGSLPHAFSSTFGREVLELITTAHRRLSPAPWPAPIGPFAES